MATFYLAKNFDQFLATTDESLEKTDRFFELAFPRSLEKRDIEQFKTSPKLRNRVIKVFLRILYFYGYVADIENWTVKRVKSLYRTDRRKEPIGLYNPQNYSRITNMLNFWNSIDMRLLSALLFLAICKSMMEEDLKKEIENSKEFQKWINTQVPSDVSLIVPMIPKGLGLRKTRKTVKGLTFYANSCYQDSVFMALFAERNLFIEEHLLHADIHTILQKPEMVKCLNDPYNDRKLLQNELSRIAKTIRNEGENVETCSAFRKLIKNCPATQKFESSLTQDAGEFLMYLFNLFRIETNKIQRKTLLENTAEGTKLEFDVMIMETPCYSILADTLQGKRSVLPSSTLVSIDVADFDKKNLYKGKDGELYNRKTEIRKLVSSSYLVFYVQRLAYNMQGHEIRLETEFVLENSVQVGSRELFLSAIVVHERHHYTCFVRVENVWFYYDDMGTMDKIGSLHDVENHHMRPSVLGVLYFYTYSN